MELGDNRTKYASKGTKWLPRSQLTPEYDTYARLQLESNPDRLEFKISVEFDPRPTVAAISAVRYRNKYMRLRQKYTELYDSAKKLG